MKDKRYEALLGDFSDELSKGQVEAIRQDMGYVPVAIEDWATNMPVVTLDSPGEDGYTLFIPTLKPRVAVKTLLESDVFKEMEQWVAVQALWLERDRVASQEGQFARRAEYLMASASTRVSVQDMAVLELIRDCYMSGDFDAIKFGGELKCLSKKATDTIKMLSLYLEDFDKFLYEQTSWVHIRPVALVISGEGDWRTCEIEASNKEGSGYIVKDEDEAEIAGADRLYRRGDAIIVKGTEIYWGDPEA